MDKTIIYGTGRFYEKHKCLLPENIEIIAYADSFSSNATAVSGQLYDGKEILMPTELENIEYDVLYICTDLFNSYNIFKMLKNYNVDFSKIRFLHRMYCDSWQYKVLEDKTILSTIENVVIRERTETDTFIIDEIFIKHVYSINILPNSIVIDLGMNVGIASLFFASHAEVEKVYGFEPFPDTYQMALDNFTLNTYEIQKKIIPCNIAVTDKEEHMDVAYAETDRPGDRSIFVKDENVPTVKVNCKPAAGVVGEIIKDNPNKNYVLKCDTEGSEFKIFDSLAHADLLTKLDSIVLEYHNDPEPIINLLKINDYRYYCRGSNTFGIIAAFRTDR